VLSRLIRELALCSTPQTGGRKSDLSRLGDTRAECQVSNKNLFRELALCSDKKGTRVLNRPPSDDNKERKQELARARLRKFREREREARQLVKQGKRKRVHGKPDTERDYPMRLLDSDVDELVRIAEEVGIEADDTIMFGTAWRRWVGDRAAEIVRNALRLHRLRR
jgi:hypothetical protein